MNELTVVLMAVFSLFVFLLVVKNILKWRFCVLCVSISVIWMTLLVLYWMGRFHQPLLIGVLMGQSITGLSYWLEKYALEKYQIFRLPFVLTLILVACLALGFSVDKVIMLGMLGLWAGWLLLYFYRQNDKIKVVVDNLIACCKDW